MTDASRFTNSSATSVAIAVRVGFQLWSGLDRLRNACGNASFWPKIYQANKALIGPNPNLIKPGQTLTIP